MQLYGTRSQNWKIHKKKLKGKYLNISVFQMLGLNTLFVVVDFATVLFCCF